MPRIRCPLVLTLLLACSGTLHAQTIWKVHHGGGPGVDFTDLPPAVAAAEPGDEIWVLSDIVGTHYYTPAVITKGIRIVGFISGIAQTYPNWFGPTIAYFEGLFTIVGLPAGEQVVLSCCRISQSQYGDPSASSRWTAPETS